MPYKDPEDRRKKSLRSNTALRAKNPNYFKEYLENNPETPEKLLARRYKQIKKFYNLDTQDYLNMIVAQNNQCAICGREETIQTKKGLTRPLCIDHCHATGKVRALLCNHCNSMLGHAKDNPAILLKSIAYLEKHKEP